MGGFIVIQRTTKDGLLFIALAKMELLDLVDSVDLNIRRQNGRTTRTTVGGFVIHHFILVMDLIK